MIDCSSTIDLHAIHQSLAQYITTTTLSNGAGFGGAFWRNSVIALVVSYAAYKASIAFTPAAQGSDLNVEHDPTATPTEADDKNMPWLTRYIAYHLPREGLWKERNAKHLELTVKQAEDQLLVQEAQKPAVRRFRYTGMFEQASPNCKHCVLAIRSVGCTWKAD